MNKMPSHAEGLKTSSSGDAPVLIVKGQEQSATPTAAAAVETESVQSTGGMKVEQDKELASNSAATASDNSTTQPPPHPSPVQPNRPSRSRSTPRIVADPDPDFDPLAEIYRCEAEEASKLNTLVEEQEAAAAGERKNFVQRLFNVFLMRTTDPGVREG